MPQIELQASLLILAVMYFPLVDVYLSFLEEMIYVNESQGVASICLELSGVDGRTEAEIWADVSSADDSATSKIMVYSAFYY